MISKECVDEERWVSQETFKKTLAVYQVLPGPEAHELCVYFGRLRGGKLGGFLAGLGFMLPGFLLMLGLSVLYVEAGLDERFEELFYGLKAAVGALVAMAIVRLGRKFITDVPLAVIAVASFGLTLGLASASCSSWSPPDSPTSCGRPRALARPARVLASRRSAVGVVAGAVTLSLTAEIFLEGLKAGLLTFGGAYTVVPFLQDTAVDAQGWLTERRVPGRARARRNLARPADHLLDLRRLRRRRPRRRPRDDGRHLPARLRLPDLLPPPARRRGREPAHPAVPARRRRRRDRPDRRGHRRDPRGQRRRRPRRRCSPSASFALYRFQGKLTVLSSCSAAARSAPPCS